MTNRDYTRTSKRNVADLKKLDFDKHIEVVLLRNQGWSFKEIAKKMGVSRQRANKMYLRTADLSIKELEIIREEVSKPMEKINFKKIDINILGEYD